MKKHFLFDQALYAEKCSLLFDDKEDGLLQMFEVMLDVFTAEPEAGDVISIELAENFNVDLTDFRLPKQPVWVETTNKESLIRGAGILIPHALDELKGTQAMFFAVVGGKDELVFSSFAALRTIKGGIELDWKGFKNPHSEKAKQSRQAGENALSILIYALDKSNREKYKSEKIKSQMSENVEILNLIYVDSMEIH